MAQVLPHVQTGLEGFGSGLGQGISASLQNLAQNKLQQMQQAQQQQQTYNTLKKIPGFTDEGARFIASLPPEVAKNFYGNIGSLFPENFFINQQPQQQQQQTPPSQRQQSLAPLQQSPAQQQNQPALQEVLQSLSNPYEAAKLIAQTKFQPNQAQNIVESQPASAQQLQTKALLKQPQEIKVEQPKTANIKKAPVNLFESPKEKHQREVASAKAQAIINEETLPLYNKVAADKDFADFSEPRLKKMKNIIEKKGGLPIAAFYNLFKNLEEHAGSTTAAGGAIGGLAGLAGGPLSGAIGAAIGTATGALISPIASLLRSGQKITSSNTEEFEKLSNEFIKGAKVLFGNRITNDELKAYLAIIPTLAQTDHGKLQIIKNMEVANKIAKIKYDAMRRIIHENGNRRPADLLFQIDDRTKSEVDKLTQQFVLS